MKINVMVGDELYPVNNFRKKKDSVLCEFITCEYDELQFCFNCKDSYLKFLGIAFNLKYYMLLYY